MLAGSTKTRVSVEHDRCVFDASTPNAERHVLGSCKGYGRVRLFGNVPRLDVDGRDIQCRQTKRVGRLVSCLGHRLGDLGDGYGRFGR